MSAARKVTIDVESWKRNLRDADPTEDDACTRWFNNYFAFWVICKTKACQRAKRCAGDADACCNRMMPHVPQRMKFELQATLKAINDKLPREAVMQRVKEEMARFDETTRVLERLGAAANSLSPLPAKRGEGGEPPSGRLRPSSTGDGGEPGEGKARGPRARML